MDYMVDKLHVRVNATREDLGRQAGADGADCIKRMLGEQHEINIMFAAAPSQDETLKTLSQIPGIEWHRVNAYHMDEYLGLDANHPAGFGNYLYRSIWGSLPLKSRNFINGNAANAQQEAERYSRLLKFHPIDICFLGVGENGHLAFNDPPKAVFHDAKTVRVVNLAKSCRQQQVNDGCWQQLEDVPAQAITVTIPGLMAARHMICSVPGQTKAKAVQTMLKGEITPDCPASILRAHENAALYLDQESAKYL